MGGRMSRNKGGRGEREVIGELQPICNDVCRELEHPALVLRRNQTQRFAKKQYDVIGLPWFSIEVKYQEDQSGMGTWWSQLMEATLEHQIPLLFYRRNHMPWRVRMKVPLVVTKEPLVTVRMQVDVSIGAFKVWFKEFLKIQLR